MQIIHKNTAELVAYSRNTRTHSSDQISQIIASIKEFGFLNPVIVDGNGILAGHGRVMAANEMGLATIPTIDASHLNDAQRRAFIIADNKIAENAGWDAELLALEIKDLSAFNFNLDILGFNDDDLSKYLDALPDEKTFNSDPDDLPPEPINFTTVAGDIWLLNGHRLMCGSCTDAHSVQLLLAGQQPNTMITDPPYGVKYEAGWRAKAKNREATERESTSSLKNDDQADWTEAWKLFPGSVAYVWHASAFTDVVMQSLKNSGFDVKQQIIWNKNVHALSRSDYHWKHEPCWYAVKPGSDRNWKGGRTQMTVWDIKSIIFEKDKTSHPTQKPVEIYTKALEHHTNPGEYVYEPFGGSGTCIIACEKLGRRSLTMELDPKFCDVIIHRWQGFTGNKATLEIGGCTFEQITEQRNEKSN